MEELRTILTLLAIYGALWASDTVLSIRNNLIEGFRWEGKYFFNGVLRAALGGVALTVGALAVSYIPEVFGSAGVSIDEGTAQAISILGVVGSIGAGIVHYARKFVVSVNKLFNPDNLKLTMKLDKDNWNKGIVEVSALTPEPDTGATDVEGEPEDV